MKRKLAGALITMLAAGLVAGCGDDGNSSTTGQGEPLAKAEFVKQADAICLATQQKIEKAATRLREAGRKSGTLAVPLVVQFIKNTSLPAYNAMLDKLGALTPPKGDEKAIDGYVAALAGAIDTTKANPVKYSKNNAPDPFDQANAKAKAYGLKVCGS